MLLLRAEMQISRGVVRFEAVKERLCAILRPMLSTWVLGPELERENRRAVLHVDEAQFLLGTKVFGKGSMVEMADRSQVMSCVLPAVCDVLHGLASERPWLRLVFSGTNFLAPLVINPGSQLKTFPVQLLGRFRYEWVHEQLSTYFALPADAVSLVEQEVRDLCANRRAVQFLFRELRTALMVCHSEAEARAAVRNGARAAADEWRRGLGAGLSVMAVQTFAHVLFPESMGGLRGTRNIGGETVAIVSLPSKRLPSAVREFALAGSINIWAPQSEVLWLEEPVGCLRAMMADMCAAALDPRNREELDAFIRVAVSVPTDKGHVLERALACEATLVGSPLFGWIAQNKFASLGLTRDMRSLGVPFGYEPRILSAANAMGDMRGRVLCTTEDPRAKGQRVVDVCVPLRTRDFAEGRMLFELKDVADETRLCRACAEYFQTLDDSKDFEKNDVAVFFSVHSFMSTQPQQRAVKSGLSAHDSWAVVAEMTGRPSSRFAVVELASGVPTTLSILNISRHLSATAASAVSAVHLVTSSTSPLVVGVGSPHLGTPV